MIEVQEHEALLKKNSVDNKKKLLDDLVQDGAKKDAEVLALQKMKEQQNNLLFNRLNTGEFNYK